MFTACNMFKQEEQKQAVARVGQRYLYLDEIASLVPEGVSKEDSVLIVQNYINTWATKNLLMSNAETNLDEDQVKEFELLVADYKTDLYTRAYLERLVARSLDTVVKNNVLEDYYEKNKDNFKLSEEVLKVRFLSIPPNNNKIKSFRDRLKRFNADDRFYLDSLSYQFSNYNLNDSVWIKRSEVVKRFPVLSDEKIDEYLKKSYFFELQDSLGVYLTFVKDFKRRGEAAPLSFIKPSIKQIILHQRKIGFMKTLKKDIINDAIKEKQFEIYEDVK